MTWQEQLLEMGLLGLEAGAQKDWEEAEIERRWAEYQALPQCVLCPLRMDGHAHEMAELHGGT